MEFIIAGIILGIYFAILKRRKQKQREDEYFRRMEETIRRANQSKDKPD